ncbi:hypothetical protein H4R19_005211 [Coemansia spiralis]|nr:hypothetical protein H4R19_005211 [Coemansia spiralis]
MFVGGLSWETDESRLRNYFSKFGVVVECSIMRDQSTGRPRGFGFVTFDSIDGVNAVLQEPTHHLDGKMIDPKHAIPRDSQAAPPRQSHHQHQSQHQPQHQSQSLSQNQNQQPSASSNDPYVDPVKDMRGEKIFVGGLPPSATDADLNSSFARFGNIIDTKLLMDRETGRSRRYGFLEYDSEDAALQAVTAGNTEEGILIHGKRIDVKPAVQRKRTAAANMGMMGMPNYGMMGMPNYGMMGMPNYGMMGMPNYGMMGMMGANGQPAGMDYSGAMGYGMYYGNMAGYYGQGGAPADGSGAEADAAGATDTSGAPDAASANAYYGQMGMPMGYYGADGQGDGSGPGANGADPSSAGYYDQQSAVNGGDSRGGRHGNERSSHDRNGRDSNGRDSSHRSSSRRHGGSGGGEGRSGRDGRERSRGDRGDHGSSRSRDDYRSSRTSRGGRDRDHDRDRDRDRDGSGRGSHGASRSHGYNPY